MSHAAQSSYGGIFSASHHFTVAGGTFTNITHNQFTMSPGGFISISTDVAF
jgi:hypothetical protein